MLNYRREKAMYSPRGAAHNFLHRFLFTSVQNSYLKVAGTLVSVFDPALSGHDSRLATLTI